MSEPPSSAMQFIAAAGDLEVPGTRKQVWEAIATGPGITPGIVTLLLDEPAPGPRADRRTDSTGAPSAPRVR